MLEARIATTDDEREAIYRHRYDVYVEELGRYFDRADHQRRRLADPEDEHSDLVYVADGGEIVASLRNTWGGQGFSARQIESYNLAPFLAELAAEVINVGERTMISPSHRGGDLFARLAAKSAEATGHDQVLLAFGACEPHLIGFYSRWQRPYAPRNINHPESGYLIPLITFVRGIEALTELGVPHDRLPTSVANAATSTGAVICSHLTDTAEYLSLVRSALDDAPRSVLAGLDAEQLASVLRGSNIITCAKGDRLVRRGGTAHTLYIVLNGSTTDGVSAGGTVGRSTALEMSNSDSEVIVATEEARVLALSERTLTNLRNHEPDTMSTLAAALSSS